MSPKICLCFYSSLLYIPSLCGMKHCMASSTIPRHLCPWVLHELCTHVVNAHNHINPRGEKLIFQVCSFCLIDYLSDKANQAKLGKSSYIPSSILLTSNQYPHPVGPTGSYSKLLSIPNWALAPSQDCFKSFI